jgi:uncharacterized protein DUF4038/collagenase-like protein with putative collagen-binding domain
MPRTRRRFLGETLSAATAAVLGRGGMMGGPALAQSPVPPSTSPWPRASFPLSIPAGKRHLEDAAGQPFLIHGDSPWSLIAQLRREDAERYLDDRQARGFNAILVNLIEHHFCSRAPANAYGQLPFLVPGDLATPNEDYFAHADWVVHQAAERGILVLLAPAYLGGGGGIEGWYGEMVACGQAKLRAYGQYVGRRYAGFTNILWVHGGDFNPPRKDLVRAIAEGIREHDTRALNTAHCGRETAALDHWSGEAWLQLDTVYTYEPVHAAAMAYAQGEAMPFFLIESAYEDEHGAGERRVRAQAYHALLSGACGQVYGNNPVWHFDGPGLFPAPMPWQQALGSRGAQSMTHLRTLFETLPWWRLQPIDMAALWHSRAPTRAPGMSVVAACLPDKSLAVIYLPTPRRIGIDLGRLAGREVRARWYDTAAGRFSAVAGSPFAGEGSRLFEPDAPGSATAGDRVLLLESGLA